MAGVLSLLICKTYSMQNTLIPASFLAAALATEKNLLKTDNQLLVIREQDATAASRLYQLFFQGKRKVIQPAITDDSVSEPDYYSSYE